jgi:hypothetical protein
MLKQEPMEEQPKQRGSIVNIASQLGIVARPGAGQSYFLRFSMYITNVFSCILCFEGSNY